MKTRFLSILTTCLLAGASFSTRAATYTVVDLGPGYAYAINSSGNIVGLSYAQGSSGPAYWDGSTYNKTLLQGGAQSATAINDDGEIAGSAEFLYVFDEQEFYAVQAAYWTNATAYPPTSVHVYGDGTLDCSDDVEAEHSGGLGIDGSGNVVGGYYWGYGKDDSGIPQEGSLLDADTTMTSPDYPDPSHVDPYWSCATGASTNGYICGQFVAAVSVDEYEIEYLWDHGYVIDGTNVTDLGTLEGSDKTAGEYSRATAVIQVGTNAYVVGYSSTASDEEHACVWTNGTYATISDLDTLSGGTASRALAVSVVSSAVQVVGQSNGTGFSGTHAFIWNGTSMSDLNDLIDSNSGWELKAAYGINSSGRIVGYGIKNNQTRAFLLIP